MSSGSSTNYTLLSLAAVATGASIAVYYYNKQTKTKVAIRRNDLCIPESTAGRKKRKLSTLEWDENTQTSKVKKKFGNLFRGVGFFDDDHNLILDAEETLFLLIAQAVTFDNLDVTQAQLIKKFYSLVHYPLFRVYSHFRGSGFAVKRVDEERDDIYLGHPAYWVWTNVSKISNHGGLIEDPPTFIVILVKEFSMALLQQFEKETPHQVGITLAQYESQKVQFLDFDAVALADLFP